MYDTIKLKAKSSNVEKMGDLFGFDPNTTYSFKIRYKNLRISIWKPNVVEDYRINIEGSIHKYYRGNNYKPFSFKNFRAAIKRLSLELGLNLKKAKVSRIDFGVNLIMPRNPILYNRCLVSNQYFIRHSIKFDETVEFHNKKFQSIFYDKYKQSKDKRRNKTSEDCPYNLLRYEIKFKSSLHETFKLPKELRLKHFLKKSTLEIVVSKWHTHYTSIRKREFKHLERHDLTDFKKFIITNSLAHLTNYRLDGLISVYNVSDLNNRKKISYYRNEVRKIIGSITNNQHYIKELDNAVQRARNKLLSSS